MFFSLKQKKLLEIQGNNWIQMKNDSLSGIKDYGN
jgi:hypothetical protein